VVESRITNGDWESGWDISDEYASEGKTKNKYKLIDEVMFELINEDIVNSLHRNGVYIFEDPQKQAVVGENLLYKEAKKLLSLLYMRYKNEIFESRMTGNMDVLFDRIDKEGFEKLNDLVNKLFLSKYIFEENSRVRIKEDFDKIEVELLIQKAENIVEGTEANFTITGDKIK